MVKIDKVFPGGAAADNGSIKVCANYIQETWLPVYMPCPSQKTPRSNWRAFFQHSLSPLFGKIELYAHYTHAYSEYLI